MIKPPFVTITIIGLIAVLPLRAGAADVTTAAKQEEARRQANVKLAQQAMEEGDKQFKAKHYDVAVGEYQLACDHLPESPLTHKMRAQAIDGLSQASVKLAEERIAEGRFEEAKSAVKVVLDPKYNPTYKPAIQLLAHLNDPEYFNITTGPKFEERVHDVQRLFIEAKSFYDSGRFDLAYKRYDQILDLDPTNTAARKGQEQVNEARNRYANEAYNETRGLLNYQVTREWETPPRKYVNREIVKIDTEAMNPHNTQYIKDKLDHIILPVLNFKEATVRDAIEYLHKKSIELDTSESDPSRRGVNIVLKLDTTLGMGAPPAAAAGGLPPAGAEAAAPGGAPAAPASSISPADTRITLSLTNIPLSEALRYITSLAGLKVKIDPYAVTIVPLSEPTDVLITKEYKVPPGFLNTAGAQGASSLSLPPGGAAAAPGTAVVPTAPTSLPGHLTALDYLKAAGVQFPPGASANFLPTSSKLVVRNTEENLDLVDTIVDSLNNTQPTQVSIESKFVEMQQTNYKELSFDYSLGTGNIGKIQYSGGNTTSPTTTFPFQNLFGGGQITSGLRTSGEAINNNAVESLLNPGATANGEAAPATFALAGVVTTAQFQAIVRAINQKKGVDLLSAPSVTTKSGQRAVIEVVVEFRYPTEFNPPQVPNITAVAVGVGGGGAAGEGAAGGGYTPVTPTTPTAFETRNTGVTLEVEPVIGPDGETIDLNLAPQVVEFDGFVNYGSPIYGPPVPQYSLITAAEAIAFGFPFLAGEFHITGYGPAQVVTSNVVNQPIFDTRKVTTSVSVWDGQTVIIGGLVREDVQTVEDKVPGLGDMPIIGRLFRSNVDQHIKRNLVMFVTARLINPAGDRVHEEEEHEEEAAPLTELDQTPASTSLPEVPLPGK